MGEKSKQPPSPHTGANHPMSSGMTHHIGDYPHNHWIIGEWKYAFAPPLAREEVKRAANYFTNKQIVLVKQWIPYDDSFPDIWHTCVLNKYQLNSKFVLK